LTAGAQVSFAGVANILYYDHVTGRVHNLDAGWKIPRYRDTELVPSLETLGDSVLVPGLLAGMFEAAEFSKFPLSTLLEPAFYFAEKGFKMPHGMSKMIKKYYNKKTLLRTDKGE
jgi:gamma-glutamyltranspeptidase